MAFFKKLDNQETARVDCATGHGAMNVGDLFTYVPSTKVAAKITKLSEAEAAVVAGKKIYLVAQGDAVTNKTGTAYKSYKMEQTVDTNSKTIVAYEVEDITNIDGYAGE